MSEAKQSNEQFLKDVAYLVMQISNGDEFTQILGYLDDVRQKYVDVERFKLSEMNQAELIFLEEFLILIRKIPDILWSSSDQRLNVLNQCIEVLSKYNKKEFTPYTKHKDYV